MINCHLRLSVHSLVLLPATLHAHVRLTK